MAATPLPSHQLAMPFEHSFRLEDPNHIAQLLNGLPRYDFQRECQYSECPFLRSRHFQGLIQLSLEDSALVACKSSKVFGHERQKKDGDISDVFTLNRGLLASTAPDGVEGSAA